MSPKLWVIGVKLSLLRVLSRLRGRLLGPYVTGVLVEARQGRFVVPSSDLRVGRAFAYGGAYDETFLELYGKFLGERSSALVVGAHIGAIAIPLARRVRRVVAIEANPEIFHFTQINVLINGLDNLELHHVAASDANDPLEFLCSSVDSGGSKVVPNNYRLEFYYDAPTQRTVQAIRLDDLLDEAFDIILMDIEGSEHAALSGMPRLLSRARTLVVELIPNHLDNVSGVTFDALIDRIPANFESFFLNREPDWIVERAHLGELYEYLRTERYLEGADLVCTSRDLAGGSTSSSATRGVPER